MEELRLRLARVVAGRCSKFAAIGAWILLFAGLAPFAGKFEAAQKNTRAAMLKGLAVTGAVITSAGIVLAGTFAVLAVLPLVALTQIGVTVAFGVLLRHFPRAIHPRPGRDDRLGRAHLVALGACGPRVGRAEVDTPPA